MRVKGKHIDWGLNFNELEINNNTLYIGYLMAEFNINLGCIFAPDDFKSSFEQILKRNEIIGLKIAYSNKYYVYEFNYRYYEKLKNFTFDFYHKEYDYHFILNYQDLFIEKGDVIFCLIIFEQKEKYHWKLGIPFLKKYKFIFDQDSKTIGFLNDKQNTNRSKTKNNTSNNLNNNNNSLKINNKILVLIFLLFLFVIIGMIFFGILIGKKIYKVRKIKTNELLELYDYNSKNNKNT